ncbi:MAG: hypothetical protein QM765_41530 [Myxococcales bacterium]
MASMGLAPVFSKSCLTFTLAMTPAMLTWALVSLSGRRSVSGSPPAT